MNAPNITTAVPKRRYMIGPYSAVVLGEVESPDPVSYRYLMAVVPEGSRDPVLYVACERDAGGDDRVRLVAQGIDQPVADGTPCGGLESFTDYALAVVREAMGLTDETPYQVM